MDQFDQVSSIFTTNPYYLAPENIIQSLKNIIESEKYTIFKA